MTAPDSQPQVTVNESGLFALIAFLIILVPLFLLLIVAINIGVTVVSTILFELVGHILLRAYGHKGSDVRLKSSVKVGAVGGAIVAIPFNILYATLEGLITPPPIIQNSEEQGATEPLLQAQTQNEQIQEGGPPNRRSTIYGTTQMLNKSLAGTARNPFSPRMYVNQRAVESPSKIRVFLALVIDFLSGPTLGALAGSIGSAVLRENGHVTLEVATAAEAGALGGLALGAVAAFVLTTLIGCALSAYWASRRP
jgi:hypothetical protein